MTYEPIKTKIRKYIIFKNLLIIYEILKFFPNRFKTFKNHILSSKFLLNYNYEL